MKKQEGEKQFYAAVKDACDQLEHERVLNNYATIGRATIPTLFKIRDAVRILEAVGIEPEPIMRSEIIDGIIKRRR